MKLKKTGNVYRSGINQYIISFSKSYAECLRQDIYVKVTIQLSF